MENVDPLVWIIAAALIIVLLLVWWFLSRRRTNHLRGRFGPDEYDRTAKEVGGTRRAEAELAARERRAAEINIRPLSREDRTQFSSEWQEVKALFVDSPAEAVLHADRMLGKMMGLRGFPVGDFEQRHAALTVDYPEVAKHYHEAHQIASRHGGGELTTEELRRALLHFEHLYNELMRDDDVAHDKSRKDSATILSKDRASIGEHQRDNDRVTPSDTIVRSDMPIPNDPPVRPHQ